MEALKARLTPDMFYIDRASKQPLQVQLATSIVSTILDTGTRPGTRLPSSRKLASELGISRLTATLVYNELVLQGYLEALPRSGYVVSDLAPHRGIQAAQEAASPTQVNWSEWLRSDLRKRRQIVKPRDWRNYPYPFIYGQADPALFNHSAWRDCVRRALGTKDFVQLADDRLTMDDELLVDYICRNTLPRRGIRARPEQILITLGAQNALWLATQLLARPDRQAILEDPGYPDFAETLRMANMPTTYLAVDKDGLDPTKLPQETGLVFVTPSHHIPTGVTMPISRRVELLRRAEMQDFLVVEDDYEFEMSFLEPPSPSLKSLDRSGRVIYVGSFSKSIFPGLRVGYLVASEQFIEQARALRAIMLRHAPTHMQRVTAYFLALGHYDAHIAGLREVFKRRRSALVHALADCNLSIAGAARYGGSSLWISAPEHIDTIDLSKRLADCGVLIEPGYPFFSKPEAHPNYFRMGYSSISADKIPGGVAIIRSQIASG